MLNLSPDLCISIMNDFLQFEGYFVPESKIKLNSFVMDYHLQVQIPLNLIISFILFNAPIYFTYGKRFICFSQ